MYVYIQLAHTPTPMPLPSPGLRAAPLPQALKVSAVPIPGPKKTDSAHIAITDNLVHCFQIWHSAFLHAPSQQTNKPACKPQ